MAREAEAVAQIVAAASPALFVWLGSTSPWWSSGSGSSMRYVRRLGTGSRRAMP